MGKLSNVKNLIPRAIKLVEQNVDNLIKETFKNVENNLSGFNMDSVRWFSDEDSINIPDGIASVYYDEFRLGTVLLKVDFGDDKTIVKLIFQPQNG